jgi:hypothetical protein
MGGGRMKKLKRKKDEYHRIKIIEAFANSEEFVDAINKSVDNIVELYDLPLEFSIKTKKQISEVDLSCRDYLKQTRTTNGSLTILIMYGRKINFKRKLKSLINGEPLGGLQKEKLITIYNEEAIFNRLKKFKFTNKFSKIFNSEVLFDDDKLEEISRNYFDDFFDLFFMVAENILQEFTFNNDIRRIIKCYWCGKIAIKERIPRKDTKTFCANCSSKNKMSKEERQNYFKEWSRLHRGNKNKVKYETVIKSIMERSRFSREEVVKMIEEDVGMQTE